MHLQISLKEIPITTLVLHLGKRDFHGLQKKLFKSSPKSDLCFLGINMQLFFKQSFN